MSKLSEQVADLEKSADIYAIALRDIIKEDQRLRKSAQDYATHPDFEALRKAINGARFAMLIASGMDVFTAQSIAPTGEG